MAEMAIEAGARILCFQELFNQYWFPTGRDEKAFAAADAVDSPVVEVMRKKAVEADVAIILPLFEQEDSRYFNSAVVIDADGTIKGTYRKLHVPDIPLWEEKFYFSTGEGNAITNSIFVMTVNRVGSEEAQDFYGISFCVNPEGELLGGPTGRQDGILLADVNLESLGEIRREWPILKERRPDLYGEILMTT